MVHQRGKDLLLVLAQPALRCSGLWARMTWRRRLRGRRLRLHLGCGDKYLPSFINVDANFLRRVDLRLDLRHRLPFPDGVVEGVYALETIEHLYPDELDRLLLECRRVLKAGGSIRIGVPHLRNAVQAYLDSRTGWFPDWPRAHQSPGGKLSNLLFCDGQHRNSFDFSFLAELLEKAGFTGAEELPRGKSRWIEPDIVAASEADPAAGNPDPHLFVEARKPG